MRCAVLGCSTTADDGETFFPVPKESKLKKLWEQQIGRYDLPDSAAVCEKHFSPTDLEVVTGRNFSITLKPGATPSILVFKSGRKDEKNGTPIRRSGREKIPKIEDDFVPIEKRKRGRPTKLEESKKSKENEAALPLNEDKATDKQPKKRKRRSANQEAHSATENADFGAVASKHSLISDDQRGEAIAEWFLTDVFEATKAISNVLPSGALINDNVIENIEETVIDIMIKVLQRISSVIITSIEDEFKKRSNVMTSLKAVFDKSKEIIKNRKIQEAEDEKRVTPADEKSCNDVMSQFTPVKDNCVFGESVENNAPCEEKVVHDHAYSSLDRLVTIQDDNLKENRTILQCAFCNFNTSSKRDLRCHVSCHLKGKRYSCSSCDYETVTISSYVMHVRTHTGDKPFSCQKCNYRTCNMSNLRRHKLIHSEEKPFRCNECGYSFRQKVMLQHHATTHSKTRPAVKSRLPNVYVCGQCNFVTLSSNEFKEHNAAHAPADSAQEIKLFSDDIVVSTDDGTVDNSPDQETPSSSEFSETCLFCPMTFSSSAMFDDHIRTVHKTEEKFVCKLCQHETKRYAYYKRHLLSHSNVRPYQCDICFVKFKMNSYLKAHIRTAHEIGPFCHR